MYVFEKLRAYQLDGGNGELPSNHILLLGYHELYLQVLLAQNRKQWQLEVLGDKKATFP